MSNEYKNPTESAESAEPASGNASTLSSSANLDVADVDYGSVVDADSDSDSDSDSDNTSKPTKLPGLNLRIASDVALVDAKGQLMQPGCVDGDNLDAGRCSVTPTSGMLHLRRNRCSRHYRMLREAETTAAAAAALVKAVVAEPKRGWFKRMLGRS